MQPEMNSRLAEMLEREALFDLVRRERFARDQRLFDVMGDCFHEDAYVRTSWYDGHGGQAYVDATRHWMETKGASGKHWVFPAYARMVGDKATVESPAMIFNRTRIDGVEVDFHVFCRFFSRAVRQDGRWKLLTFEVLFERDIMRTVNDQDRLPIDWAVLKTMRPSYQFLAYTQQSRGVVVNHDLLGDDRPEQLQAFHAGEAAWLNSAG